LNQGYVDNKSSSHPKNKLDYLLILLGA